MRAALRRIRAVLEKVGRKVGWAQTMLLVILTYFLAVGPVAILRRVFAPSPFDRLDPAAQSYWTPRKDEGPPVMDRYEKPF
jgi:hypothetical protein